MMLLEWEEFVETLPTDMNYSFRINSKEFDEFTKFCKKNRFTKSGVVRALIRRWMNDQRNMGPAKGHNSRR